MSSNLLSVKVLLLVGADSGHIAAPLLNTNNKRAKLLAPTGLDELAHTPQQLLIRFGHATVARDDAMNLLSYERSSDEDGNDNAAKKRDND
jgi:hypothetical protein